MSPLSAFLTLFVLLVLAGAPFASADEGSDDVVQVANRSGGGSTRMKGRIVDFRGDGLLLERLGRQETIPVERVLSIESTWNAKQLEADRLRAAGKHADAIALYVEALRAEPRGWVKRRLMSSLVRSYHDAGNGLLAGNAFLQLVADDPATPYFKSIPLNWQTKQPDGALAAQCRTWLDDAGNPVARLIAASWLLSTADRGRAVEAIKALASSDDPRIASQATAQLWRTQLVSAVDSDADRWLEQMERMPRELHAGPYFLLGSLRARLNQHEAAAVDLMRIPVLHPEQAELAAASLTLAARQMENLQRPLDAARLYREVVDKHPGSQAAEEAGLRWKNLAESTP